MRGLTAECIENKQMRRQRKSDCRQQATDCSRATGTIDCLQDTLTPTVVRLDSGRRSAADDQRLPKNGQRKRPYGVSGDESRMDEVFHAGTACLAPTLARLEVHKAACMLPSRLLPRCRMYVRHQGSTIESAMNDMNVTVTDRREALTVATASYDRTGT